MDDDHVQAIKAAARQTLLLAGLLVAALGIVQVGSGVADPARALRVPYGFAQIAAAIVLVGLSRLVPRPDNQM